MTPSTHRAGHAPFRYVLPWMGLELLDTARDVRSTICRCGC
jgi:hypothetical protein